jgi:hypothetical protein
MCYIDGESVKGRCRISDREYIDHLERMIIQLRKVNVERGVKLEKVLGIVME